MQRNLIVISVIAAAVATLAAQEVRPLADINARIEQRARASGTAPQSFLIGPGDILSIRVFQVQDLSGEVSVEHDGKIALPFVHQRLPVAGKTATQVAEEIAGLLRAQGLVNSPQVVVSIKEQRSGPVSVLGAVRTPSVFQASHPMTLMTALARAGGLSEEAGSIAIIRRAAAAAPASAVGTASAGTVTVELERLLSGEDNSLDIPIQGGDTITVPPAGVVYVLGAVQRPGGFSMKSGAEKVTVLTALALAQDVKSTARPEKSVIIRRSQNAPESQVPIDLKKVLAGKAGDPVLQANDILFVPDSSSKKALRRVAETALQITTGVIIWRR